MDKEEIKNRIDFNNIQELEPKTSSVRQRKDDYLVDYEGNFIYKLNPLEFKLIETVLALEERIKKLEEVK